MDSIVRCGISAAAGFLLGTLGMKAVGSRAARNLAVKGIAAGMRARAGYEGMVEQARAQVDDMVAEASYFNKMQAEAGAPQEDAPEDGPAADDTSEDPESDDKDPRG